MQPGEVLLKRGLTHAVVLIERRDLGVSEETFTHAQRGLTALPGRRRKTMKMMTDTPISVTSMLRIRRTTAKTMLIVRRTL